MRSEMLNKGQLHPVRTAELVQAHSSMLTTSILKNIKSSHLALNSAEQKGNQGIHR